MRLLLVGTGSMGAQHAANFAAMDGVEVVAAVDVRPEALATFCQQHNIANQFGSVAEALAWNEFDAATVVTPDAIHKEATLPLLAAGKNVLCEKPLAPSYADADEMATAAETAGTIAMTNLTYRGVKELIKARELVLAGAVGNIKHVEASYLQSWLASDQWGDWRKEPTWLWRLSSTHGSLGVLGDIGVHLIDFMCHGCDLTIADLHCRLHTFSKAPADQIGEYTLDANDSAVLDVQLSNGALGVVHATRWAAGHHNDLRLCIYGDQGAIEIINIHEPKSGSLQLCSGMDNLRAAQWEAVECPPVPTSMDRFAQAVLHGATADPSFRYTADLQKILDSAFASAQSGSTLQL